MRGAMAWLLGGALCVGCGTHGGKGTMYAGDVDGTACVEALPSVDVADSELTEEMRMARLLSEESLELAPPAPPSGNSGMELTAWSERSFKPWLQQKQRRADAARHELDRAALQSHRQRILAGALLGLVFEDVARDLLLVPTPRELESEPEIASMFRELLLKQAEPYLLHARRAYQACAGNALGLRTMEHFSYFCSARAYGLPSSEPEQDGVTVIRTAQR